MSFDCKVVLGLHGIQGPYHAYALAFVFYYYVLERDPFEHPPRDFLHSDLNF